MSTNETKHKKTKLLSKIAWVIVILVSIVSCIKFIYEPDIWWQIRTGNWILENGQVPKIDMLSYTYFGDPWINVKWGAEVIMAFINNTLGAELLPFLQIFCLLSIVFLVTKIHHYFTNKTFGTSIKTNRIGIVSSILLMLLIVNFRLNSRPEMFSHLFTIVSLFIILKHKNSNWIFLLIPLQIIWTNTHEAYGIGMVIMLLFLVSLWSEYLFFNKKYGFGINYKPIKYSFATISSILAVSINPHGFKMITHPLNILGQLSENKYTEELISFRMDGYWKYQSILVIFISIILIAKLLKKENSTTPLLFRSFQKIGTGYSILLVGFLYLSLTSFRNIPFFIFITTPILATILFSFETKKKNTTPIYLGLIGISIFFYFSITTNTFYKKLSPQENYGLGIDTENNPIGSAKFINDNNIKGKGFVDYLSSSYFMYADTSFKSFIDLRDLDVFDVTFFNYVFSTYQMPEVLNNSKNNGKSFWQYLDEIDNFNYIVILNSPEFQNMNRFFLHRNNKYKLVYADNLNSIYLKNSTKNQELIKKYGFENVGKNVFHSMTITKTNNLAIAITSIFKPTYKTKKPITNQEFLEQQQKYFWYMKVKF